jgi:hypothetical protein
MSASRYVFSTVIFCAGLLLATQLVYSQEGKQQSSARTVRARPWKYEEAKQLLMRSPTDPYLQYVAVQLARRENRLKDDQYFLQSLLFSRNTGRREQVDLFNTFTGALAVQESLQLDTLLDGTSLMDSIPPEGPATPVPPTAPDKVPENGKAPPDAGNTKRPQEGAPVRRSGPPAQEKKVSLASLKGPTIQSHPWEKMLAGKKPDVGVLANCVPADFYFVEFKSAAKLTQALESANLWGDHLITQMLGKADAQESEKRIKKELGIQGIPPALFDTMGLEGIAVTGSDLYLADGSDVTLLVLGKRIVALRQWTDSMLSKVGNAKKEDGTYLDVAYTHTFTPDRSVNVYSADPRPDLHIRSNSLPAFRRVLDATVERNIQGKRPLRLGETNEFAYIRTILPRNADDEDGIIYLSDPCIRRLIGPQVKLTQQRRLRAFNHLKMIERAALMFRTEKGRAPKSFEELAQAGCAPGIFGKDKLGCPAGGTYTLAENGMSASSSVFGRAEQLTPLLEIDIRDVTEKEAQAYDGFLQAYNQYWRMYFDPIAVRVKVAPKQFRLETVVLPLIDNSIYTTLAQSLGGEPVALDGLPVPGKAIHTVSVHINKQPILEMLKDVLPLPDDQPATPGANPMTSRAQAVRDILLAMHNYHSDYAKLPARAIYSKDKKPLLSWRVQLLPYLEQDQLYKQFKLDEPWDSEHNKKLVEKMPAIYRGSNAELNKQFKTKYVVPVGKDTIFSPDGKPLTFGQITVADGTSNTIALLESSDDQAVVWTKPVDWELDSKNPTKGLFNEGQDHLLVGFCDGVVRRIPARIPPQDLAHLITYKDGVLVDTSRFQEVGSDRRPRRGDIPPDLLGLDPRKVHEFLVKGIGEQASFHVLDASFPLSTEISGFIGSRTPLAEFGPMRMGIFEMTSFAMIAQSLTHPFCVMIPIKDQRIVDDFLNEIDKRFAEDWARELDRFVHLEQYQVKMGSKNVRVYAIKVLGISLRFCWCRSGNVLMIANQPQVLESVDSELAKAKSDEKEMIGHAMFRVRPENWNAVMPDYRLGWEENQRAACLVNQTRIANVARAWPELLGPDGTATPELLNEVHRIYGVKPSCPDGGNYQVHALNQLGLRQSLRRIVRRPRGDEQGSVEMDHFECDCTIHGTPGTPRQLLAPAEESATAKTLRTFGGLKATLTFMEDGLHAVVVIDRK